MRLLLISSTIVHGYGYLDFDEEHIRRLLGDRKRVAFIPFAQFDLDGVTDRVRERFALLGCEIAQVREARDLDGAEAIFTSGGNTFRLLKALYDRSLIEPVRALVRGGVPYIGTSAGSNVTAPTIKTTNDMPIVDPGGLQALGLVPFQINPHYVSVSLPGHHGETRDERLEEFAHANPALPVIGLPEGDWIRVAGKSIELRGPHRAMWFEGARRPTPIDAGRLPPLFGDRK
jgi:dipeptidase E